MKYFVVFLLVILFSCNSNTKTSNDSNDIEYAGKLSQDFYKRLKERRYDEIYKRCHDSLNLNELKILLIKKDSILGNVVRIDNLKAQTTNTTSNDVSYAEYAIELTAIYERGKQKEFLGFVKRNEDNEAVLKTYYSDPAE